MADSRAVSLSGRDARPGRLFGVIELEAVPESVSVARRFVREMLGDGHPALDDVTLVVSELVGNSVRHSDSRCGGTVAVALADAFDRIHVDVLDAGSADVPRVCAVVAEADESGELPVSGRGLWLVAEHSLAWGVSDDVTGRTVWCQVGYKWASSVMLGVPARTWAW
ncbi:hypothetical protein GCM10009677_09430 [Sphaerisporangium rubeum]|uniref:Anti-sigma regulatory factor (Ser/Thr protein kinase) n=1 Tax=Sphaerisporangium rubeum TaxID=321317 RepID=A0A7X0IJW0_9ACTN|nr:ATP-binding protein [Sphaerisporangium rubeum]MBB6476550.1 anti-sigma regulatory factor (Ser/Thr protein kinase) [Sphaerisporangium rubeum]